MAISLKSSIAKKTNKLSKFSSQLKTMALEVNGAFRNNIGKDRITPKTIKDTGKTLYNEGLGQKSITTIIRGSILKTGSSLEYMGYHLTGTKNKAGKKVLPIRNWLVKPKKLDEITEVWIKEFMRT